MLTAERLREVLRYDPETGVFTWRVQLSSRGDKGTVGSIAGGGRGDGYIVIRIDGRLYRANRLAWLYMTGEWPTHHVDHKDTRTNNNCWENLREATDHQNGGNSGLRKNNTSGFKGVSFSAKSRKWFATIMIKRKSLNLGSYPTPEEAHEAYCAAARQHFGEFARFN